MEIKQITINPEEEKLNTIVSYWTYNPTEERIQERIKRHIESENLYSFSVDNQIIGALAFKKIDETTSEITGIGVIKELRNEGYGKQILEQFDELIGSQKFIVETDDSAVGFYKHCGYSIYNKKTLDNGIERYQLYRRVK